MQAIAQPIRRVPYHLRDKLSDKLDELVKLDIIGKVSGPSSWVSPAVVVPKPSGDITGSPSSLVTVNMTLRNGVIIRVCMGNTSILRNSSK